MYLSYVVDSRKKGFKMIKRSFFSQVVCCLLGVGPCFIAASPKKYDYDLIIIGAGASGLTAAKIASDCGKKVALIEKNKKSWHPANFLDMVVSFFVNKK